MLNGTVRVRSVMWIATAVVLSVVCTLLVTQAWSVGAAPGDDDSTFVPTAGCRLVDTRPAPRTVGPRNTPLGAGDIHEVKVHGSGGECTGPLAIPSDAVAVALNVTATNATAASNIRLYPADLTEVPLLSNLNVTAGAPPTPNKVDVKLSPDGKIRVFNFNGSVNVILDVVGYYTNSSLQELADRVTALETTQPFIVASDPVGVVIAGPTDTEIRQVSVQAPVAGKVAVVASGYMVEGNDGEQVECGLMDTVADPPGSVEVFWQSPTGGDFAHISASRVFDIAANTTATYYLVCQNASGGESFIFSPQVTAIFTPAP